MICTNDDIAKLMYGLESALLMTDEQIQLSRRAYQTAEDLILAYLGRDPVMMEHTEIYDMGRFYGFGGIIPDTFYIQSGWIVTLRNAPVKVDTVVVKVRRYDHMFDVAIPMPPESWVMDDIIDGYSRTGFLRAVQAPWPPSPGGVQVTYEGGVPPDGLDMRILKRAITEQAKVEILRTYNGGRIVTSESLGEWSAAYADSEDLVGSHIVTRVRETLQPLVNYQDFV